MRFHVLRLTISPRLFTSPASIPNVGALETAQVISRKCSYLLFSFLLIVLLGMTGCRQATTDRIQGAEVFRNFHKRFYEHVMGEAPPPPRIMVTPGINFHRARKKSPNDKLDTLDRYFAETDRRRRRQLRDDLASGLIAIDEQDFQGYIGDIGHVQRTSSIGADFIVLGLTGAAAVTGGQQAKSILAALAGAITGGRIAVDKEIFYQNTFPALVQRMQRLRDVQRASIEHKLQTQSDDAYPLGMAYTDILGLYRYGTITGAIASLNEELTAPAKSPTPTEADAAALSKSALALASQDLGGRKFKFKKVSWDTTTNEVVVILDPVLPAPKDEKDKADLDTVERDATNVLKVQALNVNTATAANAAMASTFRVRIQDPPADYIKGIPAAQPATDQPTSPPGSQ